MKTSPHLHVQILTLFPEIFPGPLNSSLVGKALNEGLWKLSVINIRDFATDKHRTVDDAPYGGGAGMVMKPDVLAAALRGTAEQYGKAKRRIYLSPRGKLFNQKLAKELSAAESLLLLCGRYEGIDQRVIEAENLEEISIGDFVLSGGEIAAMAVIEAVARLLPGVVGNEETLTEESFASGLLEYPHYTRPPEWEGLKVPEILLSGNHEKIKEWRQMESERITRERRPDLWNLWKKSQRK